MSLTALVWALLYVAAVALAITNPLYPALGYLLEYYMRPALKWWGRDLPDLRYNLMISVAFATSYFMLRSSLRKMIPVPNPAARWLVGMVIVMFIVTNTVAIRPAVSWDWMTQWTKMALIFPLLLAGTLRTRLAFDSFIAVHMLGAFWWGYEAWTDPKRRAGRLVDIGSGDSLNDNAASAHLLTVLPFTLVYLLAEKTPWLRGIAMVSAPFVMNTIILCNSRGSTVGILAAVLMSFVLIKTGHRLRMIATGMAFAAAVFFLADDQYISRQQTTANYEQDGSATQRLETWAGAYELVKDRPFGSGGRGFHYLSPIYIPRVVEMHGGDLRAPHNSYAMVAAEWGVLGLICYLGIYGSAFLMTRRVKKAARPDERGYFYWRALAIQLGLVAYLVAGSFTDRLYGEAGYWLVGLSYALYRMQATEQAEADSATEHAGPASVPVAVEPARVPS